MKILKYKKVTSTQEIAKKLTSPQVWLAILAESQTKGRGRKGDRWYSPKGGLYLSLILPPLEFEDLEALLFLASFSIAKVLRDEFKIDVFIKPPNDIYLKGKKIGGVILENIIGRGIKLSVLGIGLNTNIEKFPKRLKEEATSIKIEVGKKLDNLTVAKKIIREIKKQIKALR